MIGYENKIREALVEEHLDFAGSDGLLTLKETAADSAYQKAFVHGAVAGSLLIGFHEAGPIPNLAKEEKDKGFRKKCDYALFTEVNGFPIVFFIELKSLNVVEKEVVQQLKGGACIADYLHGFTERFLNIPRIKYEERYVVFYRSRTQATPLSLPMRTRLPFPGQAPNTEPDFALALPDPDTKQYTVQDLIRN